MPLVPWTFWDQYHSKCWSAMMYEVWGRMCINTLLLSQAMCCYLGKKKSAEPNSKLSNVAGSHSSTNFLICHVQETVSFSEDHSWSGPVLDKLFCFLWKMNVKGVQGDYLKIVSHVWLFGIPSTVACQHPLSMKFSRQEYWSGLPFPSSGELPDPGIEPLSSTLQADCLPSETPGKHGEIILERNDEDPKLEQWWYWWTKENGFQMYLV